MVSPTNKKGGKKLPPFLFKTRSLIAWFKPNTSK